MIDLLLALICAWGFYAMTPGPTARTSRNVIAHIALCMLLGWVVAMVVVAASAGPPDMAHM